MISEREVRRIVARHYDGEVSKDYIIKIQNLHSDLLDKIVSFGIKEFQEYNRLRGFHKLPRLRRIGGSVFIKISIKVFKQTPDGNMGEVAQVSKDTTFSEAEEGVNE